MSETTGSKYEFLSDAWIAASRELRDEFMRENEKVSMPTLRVNLVVTDVPSTASSESLIDAHLDTSGGQVEVDLGHLDRADLTATTDYVTAKKVFVEGDTGAAMEAMQLGRLKIKGKMLKMMSLASINGNKSARELGKRIRDITA